jgi:hypothetical protein
MLIYISASLDRGVILVIYVNNACLNISVMLHRFKCLEFRYY